MSGAGLVAGKFDPPHRGHALLIDTARTYCERIIVLVVDYAEQTVPAELRAAWLREIHPGTDVRVIPDDPAIAAEQTVEEARWIRAFLGDEPIDTLFSSEHYGESLAHQLGAKHYDVDRERAMVPLSGTMVRRAPATMLDWFEPPVRAHYVPRVCVAGSESTGKTTMCERLSAHYRTLWVPEYGREYALQKAAGDRLGKWVADEFVHIAFEQQRREDDVARRANPVLICDTDALAPRVWSERYIGREPLLWPLPPSRIGLYLVPFPDVPFVADTIRDGEHRRYWMYERLTQLYTAMRLPFIVLQGTWEERDVQAIKAIDDFLAREVSRR